MSNYPNPQYLKRDAGASAVPVYEGDPRPIHVKIGPTIDGRTYFISVCMPAVKTEEDIIWKMPHRPSLRPVEERGIMLDYVMSRLDNE